MAINLPTQPTGDQYEDVVTASLRALGYFTDTHLVLRDEGTEVLELDVVATPTGKGAASRELFEAKKEAARFKNIFKLYGQRMFLGIERACLVTPQPVEPAREAAYNANGGKMAVRVCHFRTDSNTAALAPPENALPEGLRGVVAAMAWYQQIARRLALASFVADCRCRGADSLPHRLARQYVMRVEDSFFQQSPLARAEALYDAYKATPRLPGDLVQQVATARKTELRTIWNLVNDTEQLLPIQYLMLVENVARIAVLKNALDDVLERGATPLPTTKVRIGAVEVAWPLHDLPKRFIAGLETLRTHPHGLRLPYLFQSFVELLGGFIAFNDPQELQFLEDLTGVPRAEVIPALELMDQFFAPDGGTCFYKQGGELLVLKMVPAFVRGGGCFLRGAVFGIQHKYEDRLPKMGFLLSRWHNALYQILEPTLRVAESPSTLAG